MVRVINDSVRVKVPATSANIGPGFDSFGIALQIYDDLTARAITGATSVEVRGEGADTVPTDDSHLVVRAIRMGLEYAGASQVGIELVCQNRIPHGRGLGSSAAAVVAGLLIARGFIDQPEILDDHAVLALATEFEGHPDNAAPAIHGGITISYTDDDGAQTVGLTAHPDLAPVVFMPQFQLATRTARSVLPASVPHADASFNVSRAALLVIALTKQPDLLWAATEDRLHQEYRSQVMVKSKQLMAQLRQAGVPAVISGAGPTVLAFGPIPEDLDSLGEGFAQIAAPIDVMGAHRLDLC